MSFHIACPHTKTTTPSRSVFRKINFTNPICALVFITTLTACREDSKPLFHDPPSSVFLNETLRLSNGNEVTLIVQTNQSSWQFKVTTKNNNKCASGEGSLFANQLSSATGERHFQQHNNLYIQKHTSMNTDRHADDYIHFLVEQANTVPCVANKHSKIQNLPLAFVLDSVKQNYFFKFGLSQTQFEMAGQELPWGGKFIGIHEPGEYLSAVVSPTQPQYLIGVSLHRSRLPAPVAGRQFFCHQNPRCQTGAFIPLSWDKDDERTLARTQNIIMNYEAAMKTVENETEENRRLVLSGVWKNLVQ
jgi:hypothetical protein